MMTLENDLPDFEPDQLNPMQQVMEIVELAHKCVSQRKAYANVSLFGGNEQLCATVITDVTVEEYEFSGDFFVLPDPDSWEQTQIMYASMADQPALQAIINRLNEVLL